MHYESVRRFEIPQVRQSYTEKDVILYALSVGAGERIADGTGYDFLSENRGLKCLPSFAVVLGHPGFWVSDPKTTIDWTRNVHAEESFRIVSPLPPSGTIVGTTRIVDIVDKGAEKGALMYTQKDITDAETGELLAVCERVQFLRGDGGYDGPSGPARPAVADPASPPDIVRTIATRDDQAFLYRLNGDPNPLHIDPEVAKRGGFEKPILHGLCSFGMAATLVLFELANGDADAMRGFRARFTSPVYAGESLSVEIWKTGEFRVFAEPRNVLVLSGGRADIALSAE
jgi:acyl dehydratase